MRSEFDMQRRRNTIRKRAKRNVLNLLFTVAFVLVSRFNYNNENDDEEPIRAAARNVNSLLHYLLLCCTENGERTDDEKLLIEEVSLRLLPMTLNS